MQRNIAFLVLLVCAISLSACGYVKLAARQIAQAKNQWLAPSQGNLVQDIERDNFILYGKVTGFDAYPQAEQFAVAAFSDKFKKGELVDMTMTAPSNNTYFGLYVPDGRFVLVVFADLDNDGYFAQSEAVALKTAEVSESADSKKVAGDFNFHITPHSQETAQAQAPALKQPIKVPNEVETAQKSLFYPPGTIRKLSDPAFSPQNVQLGIYRPKEFMEKFPMSFYALEEHYGHKVPVIFVHGFGGAPRDFAHIVDRMDRTRYAPWFFFYPSAKDLSQTSQLFYDIFLSGDLIPTRESNLIIVAHSMGGLIVRDALGRMARENPRTKTTRFISIATPFGGHPASASGVEYSPVVLPSWRDVDPKGEFITTLFDTPRKSNWEHFMLYAFSNETYIKLGENSDGAVPMSSQLAPPAQKEATRQFGFNSNHVSILRSPEALEQLHELITDVKSLFPDQHLEVIARGGYPFVELDPNFTPMEKYMLTNYGKYFDALRTGELTVFHPEQERFIQVLRGEAEANTPVEKAWVKFATAYPNFLSPAPEVVATGE